MVRKTRRTRRIRMSVRGYKDGQRILSATRLIPASFTRVIEASSATEFIVKVVYGRTMTSKGIIEDIIDEVEGPKDQVLECLKIWLSASELDFSCNYWGL
jgi:hypothetical protein